MTDDAKEQQAFNDYMRSWQEQMEQERRDRHRKFKDEILPALRGIGVAVATLDYDGSGDSLNSETLTLADADGKPVSNSMLKYDENEMIELMSSAAPDGYENNEGGFGQVIINVAAGTVRNEHSQRVEQIEYSEEEYEI